MSRVDPPRLRAAVVQVVCATFILAAIGAVSMWVGQALLVASLGSAAFIQVMTPDAPGARVWPMAAGQLCGVAAGFIGVAATSGATLPPFIHDHTLVWTRVLAAAIAIAVAGTLQLGLKATSAAGATLALLIALGSEPATWAGALRLTAGVALIVVLGETSRRLVLRARDAPTRPAAAAPPSPGPSQKGAPGR